MKSLIFNQLQILSHSEKSGNQFEFRDHLNLITAENNNVGKSTIIKLLYWTLGCELEFDTVWKNLDCRSIVKFEVGEESYEVMRYKNSINLKEGNKPIERYSKITGDYSKRFAEIVKFKLLLANSQEILEVPPPAFYFLPYYIDQKKSWSEPWRGFENLGQYSNPLKNLVQYHVGVFSPEYFEIEAERYVKLSQKKLTQGEIQGIETVRKFIDDNFPNSDKILTLNQTSLEVMTDEIKIVLAKLATEQEEVLIRLGSSESERSYLLHQKSIAEKIINEIELDYKFSVENIEDDDDFQCPLCGTNHPNTILARSAILVDKEQAENQLVDIKSTLLKNENEVGKTKIKLENIRQQIEKLNSKYNFQNEVGESIALETVVDVIAGRSIQEKTTVIKKDKLAEISALAGEIKQLNKAKKELSTDEKRIEITNFFFQVFHLYAEVLKAEDVNLSAINSPLDYSKVKKEGGAAENTRVVLAYDAAIYSTIGKFNSYVKAPLVIDTPNQQDQSNSNYGSIIKLITEYFKNEPQLILCALNNKHLDNFKSIANVIEVTSDKILKKSIYKDIEGNFKKYDFYSE
ncbi:hypothetical protein BH09BAC1_BH09BAC1_13590 [soil metagenome]